MAVQFKLSLKRGQRAQDVVRSGGSAIAGSDAVELNVDATRMGKFDVLVLIEEVCRQILGTGFPQVAAGGPLTITTAPTIAGDNVVGQYLFATNGTYSLIPDSFSRQWYLDGVAEAGETNDTFLIQDIYAGKVPSYGEVAHKAGYADAPLNMSA